MLSVLFIAPDQAAGLSWSQYRCCEVFCCCALLAEQKPDINDRPPGIVVNGYGNLIKNSVLSLVWAIFSQK